MTKRFLLLLLAAALPAGCAQSGSVGVAPPVAPSLGLPDALPPSCKGQKTTKNYAKLTVALSTKGGSLCIPAFGGFGGSVKYPSANPSRKLTVISNTKNYDHQPNLGSGAPIFYLQLALSGSTNFGKNVSAGGGLTSATIVPGNDYTVFGRAVIYSIPFDFTPCYTVATAGKYGGVIGGVGTLLKGQSVPASATGAIEIYSGKQANDKC